MCGAATKLLTTCTPISDIWSRDVGVNSTANELAIVSGVTKCLTPLEGRSLIGKECGHQSSMLE